MFCSNLLKTRTPIKIFRHRYDCRENLRYAQSTDFICCYGHECCYGHVQNGLRGAGTRQRVQDKVRDMTKKVMQSHACWHPCRRARMHGYHACMPSCQLTNDAGPLSGLGVLVSLWLGPGQRSSCCVRRKRKKMSLHARRAHDVCIT